MSKTKRLTMTRGERARLKAAGLLVDYDETTKTQSGKPATPARLAVSKAEAAKAVRYFTAIAAVRKAQAEWPLWPRTCSTGRLVAGYPRLRPGDRGTH